MKQKYIAFLAFLGILFLPVAALAQTDLSVTEADVSIGDSLDLVEVGKEVRIFATINNLGEEDAIADAEFYAGNTLLGSRNVTILAGESAAAFWDWTPDTAQTLEISVSLTNISVEDTDESNNSIIISTVDVLEGDLSDSEETESDQEVIEEETSEEEIDEKDQEEQSSEMHEVMVQAQRLAWDTFRFMPAGLLDSEGKEFLWNFGDDSTSSEQVAEHSYGKPGTYQVSLQILGGEMPENASMQVRVGFFHLANWRLWIVIVVLALIIIVGAVVAGMSGSMVDSKPKTEPKVPDPNIAQSKAIPADEDILLDTSSADDGIGDELALLDDLDQSDDDSSLVKQSSEERTAEEVVVAAEEKKEPEVVEEETISPLSKKKTTKAKTKKKSPKAKSKTKKKATTKKKSSKKSTKAKTKTTKKKKATKKK